MDQCSGLLFELSSIVHFRVKQEAEHPSFPIAQRLTFDMAILVSLSVASVRGLHHGGG